MPVEHKLRKEGRLGSLPRCVHRCLPPGVWHNNAYRNKQEFHVNLKAGLKEWVAGWVRLESLKLLLPKRWVWVVEL